MERIHVIKTRFEGHTLIPHLEPFFVYMCSVTPFSTLGFDQVATKFHENMTLEDIVAVSSRFSLGRPLYVFSCPVRVDAFTSL